MLHDCAVVGLNAVYIHLQCWCLSTKNVTAIKYPEMFRVTVPRIGFGKTH